MTRTIYKNYLSLVFILLISCNQVNKKSELKTSHTIEAIVRDSLKNEISIQYKECLPDDWEIWEEYSEEHKIQLNHIGKGEFDLHFKAKYQVEDTLFPENFNGKNGNKYSPELILAFFKNEKSTKESVKFTREHWQMVSDLHPMYDIAETENYLIYGGYSEDQKFEPQDSKLRLLKECIKSKKLSDKHY